MRRLVELSEVRCNGQPIITAFEVLCVLRNTLFSATSSSVEIAGRNLNWLPQVNFNFCSRTNFVPLVPLLYVTLHFLWHRWEVSGLPSLDDRLKKPQGNLHFSNTMGWSTKLSQIAAVAFYSMQFNSKIHKPFPCSLQHVKIQYMTTK